MAKKVVLKDNSGNKCYPVTRDVCILSGDRTLPEKYAEMEAEIPFKKYIINGGESTVKFGSLLHYRGETVAMRVSGIFSQYGYFKDDGSFTVVSREKDKLVSFIVPEDGKELFVYTADSAGDAIVEFFNPVGYMEIGSLYTKLEQQSTKLEQQSTKLGNLESSSFLFSKNERLASFFKELYCPDLDLSLYSNIQIAKAQEYQGTYNNIIRFNAIEGSPYIIHSSSYSTQEEALLNLKSGYFDKKGFAVVDWDAVEDGKSIIFSIENIYLADYIFDINYSPTIRYMLDVSSQLSKIDKLEQAVVEFNKELYPFTNIEINIDGYINSKGSVSNSSVAKRSDRVKVYPGFVLDYSTRISAAGCALAFYDKEGNFIDDLKILGTNYIQKGKFKITDARISTAAISHYNYPSAYLRVSVEGNLMDRVAKLEEASINNVNKIGKNNIAYSGINLYQRPTKDINHFIIYGQSLSTGQQTCPELSRSNYRGNLMVGQYEWVSGVGSNTRDSLTPLKAISTRGEGYIPTDTNDQTEGETPNINFANAAKRLLDDFLLETVDRKILATSCGSGGRSIELLSKNCPNNSGVLYSNFVTALTTAKTLAEGESKSLCCSAIIWMQGEYNANSQENQGWEAGTPATNSKDAYKSYLLGGSTSDDVSHNGLINDMIEDVKAQYGQEDSPLILSSQIGPNFNRSFDNPIDMALLEANNENDNFVLVAPSYCVTDRGAHLDSNGSRWLGEYYAKVWYKKVILGLNWKPLQPNKVEKGENYLLITFDVPEPPLVFDNELVREKTNYGFKVKDGGQDKSIQAVEILGGNIVKITCSSAFVSDVEVAYATQGVVYGNLRDSDNWKSFEKYKDLDTIVENPEGVSYKPSFEPTDDSGSVIYNKNYPCYNWCLRFYYKLLASESELNINTGF